MSIDARKDSIDKLLAFEDKVTFEVACRTTKIYALWAAEQLNMEPTESGTYAADLVVEKVGTPGFGFLVERVQNDFLYNDIEMSENILMMQLERCIAEAQIQISNGI